MFNFFSSFSNDIGIDLGTANTLVYLKGKGIVLREPSVVALNNKTQEILAVGNDAKKMIGRTPGNISAVRPLRDGVISDFDLTHAMLRYILKKISNKSIFRSRLVIGVPSGITTVEKRAVTEAGLQAGAREVYLIEEPMAAAIGAGLIVEEAFGSMVVDIGGGTTEIAVISLGGIVSCNSIRVGGDQIDFEISQYIRRQFNILIGERTAEEIKIQIGTAIYLPDEIKTMNIFGRDLTTGLPKSIEISSKDVQESLCVSVEKILEAVVNTLEETPPELTSDIIDNGIVMTGGGALLHSLDTIISHRTGVPVIIADNPLDCVAIGTGKVLSNVNLLSKIKFN